jgi:serine/threonine protein kinase/tetratricopeptide (TPR) repeat protein
LTAVHKQKLVHRDIKPSNIMVSLEDTGAVTVKIIDLGLAKSLDEPGVQTAISTPGAFAGTPEFASPEQFGGVGADIRSDLYSLGITLWEMVTGKTPFRGTPGEVMYQHQHSPLPLEELEGVPQPLVVLLAALLEKDPGRRFQNPVELLKAIPTITERIEAGRRITRDGLRKMPPAASRGGTRKPPARRSPKKVSVARLPVTGSDLFGREEDIAFLDDAWANKDANVVTIVAWAGVGKSTLVNHWLRRMAAEQYCSAELVFGWSFYRQGTSGDTSSADEFLDAALTWFEDPDPRLGTAWEKGERLAKLISPRRTLLVLDGLEPLQNPPGPQEGRLREPSLQALLRELAAFNKGLCVITTRTPVADIADHERASALRRDLEQLSSDAGAKLLRALGVKGDEAELRSASEEFTGHCLALTLIGSYLTDAYDGNIRYRDEVSKRLAHDVRQGVHARKVMESYQSWLGEGPELAILRLLGLFDRPADQKAICALLKSPTIPGLTESLTDLSPSEWRRILARLRRARLLAGEDPHNPGQLDTHPLVREYFGEQLRSQQTDAWKECNRRLFHYYKTLAPQLPNSFSEMAPLFSAVVCGCNAGLFREALHEVYISRVQRENASFAANVLGARATLLSVLVYFFEHGRWQSPVVEMGLEGQGLTSEDQLFILMQAALYLTAIRGMAAPEVRICYERAESLCNSLNRPLLLYSALMGQWRYSLMTDKLSATMQIAKRVYSLAHEQDDPVLMIGACQALASTSFFLGDFESTRQQAMRGVEIWRSGCVQSPVEQADPPVVVCLCYEALSAWQFGEFTSCQSTIADAISIAKELNDTHALAEALFFAAILGSTKHDAAETERMASEVTELSVRYNFATWLPLANILRGWARSTFGDRAEGIAWIEDGIRDCRARGSVLSLSYYLKLKAEALHLADRTSEALEAINEAETLAQRTEERHSCADLHRLRGVFLSAMGADETQIEASFCEAIRIAREQKSISLTKRAEESYAEYRSQQARASAGLSLPAEKISVARLPVTGSEIFGREEDIAFLDDAWANQHVNVVTIVAWAGVGKSTLVNHWLRRLATDHYRSAELIFGWSFYRQGTSGETSSADEFLDAALSWFGDPNPRLGTPWQKGERLTKLVAHRRTLLILDGLEPLQNPPGPQEGRLREPSLQALLRELAAFNKGLCLITTRAPIADIADCEGSSALRRDLEQLSSDAGGRLLRALGVKGSEAELQSASEELGGHCLALTLLGSYLTDAYNGDIRCRTEVSGQLAQDVRQGAHARKVMESYQTWLGEGPELSVLRMLGLFDRPADEKALGALLKSPAIPGLTESLTDLSATAWRTTLAKLRRARLLAGEDPHNPGHLDTHPLVREYFGEQLRSQITDAWKECNRRLYEYYRTLAPELPDSLREMEPLFLAVICGCNAGLFRAALHEVYIPRIQRGNASFAANALGARGALLSVLIHFFERGRWGPPVEMGVEGQSLTAEDRLFILMQAQEYLTVIRGWGAPEAQICSESAASLCHSLDNSRLLCLALWGQWLYALTADKVSAALPIAERLHSLAQEQDDPTLMIHAYNALAATLYWLGDFEAAREHAIRGAQIWRSGNVQPSHTEQPPPVADCFVYQALSEWHLGEIVSSQTTMAEAVTVAKELHATASLALALQFSAALAYFNRKPAEVDRWASDLIELATRHNFALHLATGSIQRGWVRSVSGDTAEGISLIEDGIREYRAIGPIIGLPFFLTRKAEALHLADRTSEALEAINEAEAFVERTETRWWCIELHRLRGVFLTAIGGEESQIEASFCEAIRIAKEQKSVSLTNRAEATYAEYRRQKASGPGGRVIRLPLW